MKPEIKFARRMLALFGAPEVSTVDEVVAEYANALRGNTLEVLDRAADKIAHTRRIRAWPTVAECLDAVAEARRLPAGVKLDPIENFEDWYELRCNRIETAETEAQIAAELAIIEPYHVAKWIRPQHWHDATALAHRRRKALASDGARKLTDRIVGEAAE